MTDVLKPRDSKDVEDAVQWALAGGKALEVVGGGSKRAIGRPAQTDLTLDLSGLSGVTLYEPEELVLTAKAGTPLAEIEALVAAHNQMLAFEPPDYGCVLGGAAGRATLGGVLAANLAGPRRIKAGAARDHFLGFSAVSGRGETFKSGGRVVKNVTGYDLCKLMAGSWGTLAVMTDVTIKVLPRPDTEETVTIPGLDDAAAVSVVSAAMGLPCEVSGAAHLPAPVARRVGVDHAITALRLEGVPASIAHRRHLLEAALESHGDLAVLAAAESHALWQKIRDVTPFAAEPAGRQNAGERPLWRISTAPARGAELANAIGAGAELFYDWAGGLIWVALAQADDAGAKRLRPAVKQHGGHATLIRAPAAVRAAVDVFEPEEAALAALSHRVKESFDPQGVLNPGRMWAGV